ncbi:MAG: MotA/TolQ/ExbB proton channel family protein [Phycisphaerales bacterium]
MLSLAQSAPPALTVWDFAVKGGIVMIPIGICSLFALGLTVERLVALRQRRLVPPELAASLRTSLAPADGAGPDVVAARRACDNSDSSLARVCAAALDAWDRPIEHVERLVADAGRREILTLRRPLRGLSLIASIAPLLGLLGTIFGMITAFRTIATSPDALGRTELLAAGIYEAMVTTAAGLIVAIPALLMFHMLSARLERIVLALDAQCLALFHRHGTRGTPTTPGPVPQAPADVQSNGTIPIAPKPAALPTPALAAS